MLKKVGSVDKVALALTFITVCALIDDMPIIIIKLALEVVILGALCVIVWILDYLGNGKEKTKSSSDIVQELDEAYGRKWSDKEGKYVKD